MFDAYTLHGVAPSIDGKTPSRADTGTRAKPVQLRLMVDGLADSDTALLGTFLRLGRDRLSAGWAIVLEPPADLLLINADDIHTILGLVDEPALTLRVVTDVLPNDRQRVLARPLQYDAVMEALAEVEMARHPQRNDIQLGASTLSSAFLASTESITFQQAPTGDVVPGASFAFAPQTRFRLRRWPPNEALRGQPHFHRLACFLSTRHLNLVDLARLSNVPIDRCTEFVALLHRAGVLNIAAATVPAQPIQASPILAVEGRRPTLFGRLRVMLGVSW